MALVQQTSGNQGLEMKFIGEVLTPSKPLGGGGGVKCCFQTRIEKRNNQKPVVLCTTEILMVFV